MGVQVKHLVMCAVCLVGVWPVGLEGEGEWEIARTDYAWRFPQDHWARTDYKTEWWYFTGHLESESGRRFGYQFTFFRAGLMRERPDVESNWGARDLIMGHAALSTLPKPGPSRGAGELGSPPSRQSRFGEAGGGGYSGGAHRFSELLYRAVPLLGGFGTFPDTTVAWSRGPAGTDGDWRLAWNGEAFDFRAEDDDLGFAFELRTRPVKAMIFQGPNGYSKKGEGASAASQYYSFTRLATEGTVSIDGETFRVTGQSWMDKEFFTNSLAAGQVGWDWFSLQLDDNRELMLYVLRDGEGRVDHARGTLVGEDGEVTYLEADAFTIEATDTWTNPTGETYPSAWTIRVTDGGLDLRVRPQMADQENRSALIPTLRYWEGAVDVVDGEGRRLGVGFVEMTGYGSATTPAI